MGRLDGKVAIITGAAGGFGLTAAKIWSKEGAKIVIADLMDGTKAVEEIRALGGEAISVQVNVTVAADCEAMVKAAVDAFGKLDILYCNAGLQLGHLMDSNPFIISDVAHHTEAAFDKMLAVNYKGPWLCCKYALPELVKTKGCVLITASVAGVLGTYGCSAYGSTKAAMINLAATIANEYGRFGVRANCVSPYVCRTPGNPIPDSDVAGIASGNPMNIVLDQEDIAYAGLFLVSDEAAHITGQNLIVDGGATIQSQPMDLDAIFSDNQY